MDANDMTIPERDLERLEAMVAQYRYTIFNLYRLAYLQGEIDSAKDINARIAA